MNTSIYELTSNDVKEYLSNKGINKCFVCGHSDTLTPLHHENSKLIFRNSELLTYNEETKSLEVELHAFEVMVTCSHCANLTSFPPGALLGSFNVDASE